MISNKSIAETLLPSKLKSKLREGYVSMNVTHLHGPRAVQLSKNEAAVTCVLRNGEYYLETFIEHYSKMGFRHIFLLDNGSNDETLSIARGYDNVSICQSTLPISSNQRLFKKYLASRSLRGGWCLDADIDEFFDYPLSDVISLREFLDYLNQQKYTAVITQLLDMFSDKPLSYLTSERKEDLKTAYRYYDVSDITKTDYLTSSIVTKCAKSNVMANSRASLYWGGIRKTLYGNDCLLTKHSLFFPGGGIDLFPHVHFTNRASVADVSGVMLHYKLTSNAVAMALQNRDNFTENSKTYNAFVNTIQKDSGRVIRRHTAKPFVGATDLAKNGFLFMSPTYEEYAMASEINDWESQCPAFKA